MRILGGILIMGGSVGLGLWYRARFIGGVRAKRILVRILELLMSEIRYGKAAMPECCEKLAGQMEEPYKNGFREVVRLYREGGQDSFVRAFCEAMGKCLGELPLKKEDREIFFEPFRTQGFQDGEMQLKCLEQSRDRLLNSIRLEEKELPGKCKMAVSLGGMSGLVMLIILL